MSIWAAGESWEGLQGRVLGSVSAPGKPTKQDSSQRSHRRRQPRAGCLFPLEHRWGTATWQAMYQQWEAQGSLQLQVGAAKATLRGSPKPRSCFTANCYKHCAAETQSGWPLATPKSCHMLGELSCLHTNLVKQAGQMLLLVPLYRWEAATEPNGHPGSTCPCPRVPSAARQERGSPTFSALPVNTKGFTEAATNSRRHPFYS